MYIYSCFGYSVCVEAMRGVLKVNHSELLLWVRSRSYDACFGI